MDGQADICDKVNSRLSQYFEHNKHTRQTSAPLSELKPTITKFRLPQTNALGRTATGMGYGNNYWDDKVKNVEMKGIFRAPDRDDEDLRKCMSQNMRIRMRNMPAFFVEILPLKFRVLLT